MLHGKVFYLFSSASRLLSIYIIENFIFSKGIKKSCICISSIMTSENLPHLQECNETFERVRSAFSCIASYLSKTSLPCTLRLIMFKYFLLHCWRCFLRTLGNVHVCVLTFVALRGRPVWLHKLINQLRVFLFLNDVPPHCKTHSKHA